MRGSIDDDGDIDCFLTKAMAIIVISSLLLLCLTSVIKIGNAQGIASEEEDRKIVVGAYSIPPFVLENQNNTHKGIFLDLLEHIAFLEGVASTDGWEIEYQVSSSYNETMDLLMEEKVDMMLPAVHDESVEGIVYSNTTIIDSWGSLFTRSDSDINSYLDLENKTIGIKKNGIHARGENSISEEIRSFDVNCKLINYSSYEEIFEAVKSGEIDAGATDKTYFQYVQEDDIRKTSMIFDHVSYRFAYSANSSDYFRSQIDDHLNDMKGDEDSIYYELLNQYLGQIKGGENDAVKIIPDWINMIMLIAAGALALLGSMIIILDKKVKEKTEELKDANDLLKEDIAKRKRAEERGSFLLTLLRHDLKNKYMILEGYLQLLEDADVEGALDETIQKALRASSDSKELLDKVGLLRDIDREEELKKVDPTRYILNANEKNEAKAQEAGIEIKHDLDGNIKDADVYGGELLEEMFSNLIENAIKHANCEVINLKMKVKEDSVIVTIEDDGIGIPEDRRDKIFDKSYKGPDSSGTGIGTYLVKKILETYGGDIEVSGSELGGARFDVTLCK